MHIYFHIPFCASKCHYCAFASSTNTRQMQAYFDALKLDLLRFFPLKKSIKTIYFGGGTPSLVPAGFYSEIFSLLRPFFANDVEISAEANPNSLNANWLNKMRDFGLNRLSLGVQSFDDEKLKFLGRSHSSEQALRQIALLKKEKMNFSIDLIYGTFLDDEKMQKSELETLKKLELNHLSAYTLIIEKNTPFEKHFDFTQKNDDLNINFYENLQKIGLKAYEISNFASDVSFICRHNYAYWQKKDYLGIGLSSVGSKGLCRYSATSEFEKYLQNPIERTCEILSKKDDLLERIFLGLRSSVGVAKTLIKDEKKLKNLENEGLILQKNGVIYNQNYLLSDEIALYLVDN